MLFPFKAKHRLTLTSLSLAANANVSLVPVTKFSAKSRNKTLSTSRYGGVCVLLHVTAFPSVVSCESPMVHSHYSYLLSFHSRHLIGSIWEQKESKYSYLLWSFTLHRQGKAQIQFKAGHILKTSLGSDPTNWSLKDLPPDTKISIFRGSTAIWYIVLT